MCRFVDNEGEYNLNRYDLQYQFSFEDSAKRRLIFRFDGEKTAIKTGASQQLPDWTLLTYNQCPNCVLTVKHCPIATNIVEIIEKFDGLISYEKADLVVRTHNREISIKTTVQQGMSSLMGLAMASSGCPHTTFFAPMAHFHKPLADIYETVFRAASSYLLSQYFLKQDGRKSEFNLEGLTGIYKNLQIVNKSVAKRLRSITETDSSVNAVIILDSYAQALPLMLDSALNEIKEMYAEYHKAV